MSTFVPLPVHAGFPGMERGGEQCRFGAYGTRLAGLDAGWTPVFGAGIVVMLATVNVAGVRTSAGVEDFIVDSKVLILLALAAIGLTAVRSAETFPVLEGSATSVVGAAGLIFVGYEGFQLLTYDYDEISAPERTLPHAIWISICFVTLLYMLIAFVLTGSVPTITAQEETVLAEIARPALGRTGLVLVLVAAVFSTSSAINATLFATGRLAKRIGHYGELPPLLTSRLVNGVPIPFLTLQVALSVVLVFTANLEQIVTFSSLVFLLTFFVVNVAAVWHRVFPGVARPVPVLGALGCLGAVGVLGHRTFGSPAPWP